MSGYGRPRPDLSVIARLIGLCVLAFAAMGGVSPASGAQRNVQADLVSSRLMVTPGERFTVALRQQIRPGWHTYWRNPGDSGLPTAVQWTAPKGYAVGPLGWPAPEIIRTGDLVTYGYENEALLPFEITVPADASGAFYLRGHATWLVCADVCVPEEADLALDVPVGPTGRDDPIWSARLAAARASLPQPARIDARIGRDGQDWRLQLTGGGFGPLLADRNLRNPVFLPYDGAAIDHAADQRAQVGDDAISLRLVPAATAQLGVGALDGIVEYEARENGGWVKRAVEISAQPGALAPAPTPNLGLAAALVFALIGGLILNVMPCVFPVLSIKALALARGHDEADARRQGVFFLAGVMAAFLTLAGVLIALQAGGAAIGWGFQLQEPLAVGALALLFFVIGLNLLGAFEIGGGVQTLGNTFAMQGGGAGSFFTGALAVIAATPCTAPFMGAALGYAVTQPAWSALLVFAALGLGFALPFFALSIIAPLRAALPKPGAWMETFKQILAFPMFAAAIWLVWVLTRQRGADGGFIALAAFLATGFFVWAIRALKPGVGRWSAAALALIVVFAAGVALVSLRASGAASVQNKSALAWSLEREAALRAAGKPVFVDFTAAWCVTCQVNDKVALRSSRVLAAFARQDVTVLVADWTSRNAAIAAELKAHGRDGVPLYLFYAGGAPDAPPKILPQILTPELVLDALAAQENK